MDRESRTIDVVICSIDEAKFEDASRNLTEKLSPVGLRRITRIPDAKSMTEGYNRGAALGSSDWIIFCHDDISILHFNPLSFATAQHTCDIFGACGTTQLRSANWYDSDPNRLFGSVFAPAVKRPGKYEHQIFGTGGPLIHRVHALDGIFIACRRDVWKSIGFSEDLTGFTLYDVDFCYRAYLNRRRICVLTDLLLFHDSHVDSFSGEKMQAWRKNQSLVNRKFNLRATAAEYIKHETIGYETLPSAVELAELVERVLLTRR